MSDRPLRCRGAGATIVAALTMVSLHRTDGGVVAVTPSHVTSLHARAATGGQGNKVVAPEARCVVWLTDGKLLSVIEPCNVVRSLLEEAAK